MLLPFSAVKLSQNTVMSPLPDEPYLVSWKERWAACTVYKNQIDLRDSINNSDVVIWSELMF